MESKLSFIVSSKHALETFNRTSLESKRFSLSQTEQCRHPFNRTSLESKLSCKRVFRYRGLLLIEPVWNRNTLVVDLFIHLLPTFNRTSLESKLLLRLQLHHAIVLLIEPVWNRNAPKISLSFSISWLLIEPVWNRNRAASLRVSDVIAFNRTSLESKRNRRVCNHQRTCPFNRTSLESKPCHIAVGCWQPCAFNRTSLESKLSGFDLDAPTKEFF